MIKLSAKPTNTILVKVSTDDEHTSFCRFAVVKFYKDLVSQLKVGRDMSRVIKMKIQDLYQITIWGGYPTYIPDSDEGTCGIEELEEEGKIDYYGGGEEWWFIKDLDENELPNERVDTQLIKITPDDFHFDGYVKHTNVRIYTVSIGFEILDKIAKIKV